MLGEPTPGPNLYGVELMYKLVENLRCPNRPVRIAAPCCGILQSTLLAFQVMMCKYELVNVFDVEEGYKDSLLQKVEQTQLHCRPSCR